MSEAPPRAPKRDAAPGGAALLIIDMINRFDFSDGAKLASRALTIADPILALRQTVDDAGFPVIYVNDNFGEWHSERSRIVDSAIERGSAVAKRLRPGDDDYFVIKPQFSGFYSTNLPVLLPKLGVDRLILAGVATDICVLFTAGDAHMRDYALWVPEDLVAAASEVRGRWALEIMQQSMGAETAPTTKLTFADWMARLDR